MKTKEELISTYIKYSSDITEEIWDKLVIKFKELGFYLWQNKGYNRYKEGSIIFINEKGDNSYWVTDGYFTPNADKKEIQVSDILGEESQFEVGKYYFYNWDWRDSGKFICKIEKVSDNYIHCEWEYDIENKEFDDASGMTTRLDEISEVKELTQGEIQQYLPEGHPDKLPKTIEKWSVGSYGVVIQSKDNNFPLGTIDKIVENRGVRISFEKFLSYKPNDLDYAYGMEFKWFATLSEAEAFSKSLLEPEESKEMQLSDLKNPVFNIGDKVRVIADSLDELNSYWTNGNNTKYKKGYEGLITEIDKTKSVYNEVNTWYYLGDKAISCNLLELVEPVKKEFDRDWYVEVNNQEEADKVFEYLESIGEVIVADENYNRKYLPDAGEGYKYIYYRGAEWFLGENPRNRPQKQLSDILPNYSKVNRNIYYEVSNQEEHGEILDWLKSMGEKVDRESKVMMDWKFIYYRSLTEDWCLGRVKPDLPKAEFPFKSKQSIKVDTYFEEACPFPSVDLSCFNTFISGQFICPTIKETPTNEKEIISKIKKSIEF